MTINKDTAPRMWPRFDEQNYLEFCPSVVCLPNGERWVAFRRNKRPPVWGAGEIWMVRVDQELQPIGEPLQLIPEGEDPRLLLVGERLFLFYVYVDRSEQGEVIGTTIALAELAWRGGFSLVHHVKLPKDPLGTAQKPDNSMVGYEKNWVPFFIDANTIGILYSHSPWIVMELSIAGGPASWRFGATHRGAGIEWGYGEIRGGSVPIAYGEDEYITFFHSSAKTGGKKIYYGGACVFSRQAPYSPRYFTPLPLTTSPFKAGSDKHGWYLGQPIIFPLGVAYHEKRDAYDILCSLDDAFICLYSIARRDLPGRLANLADERRDLRTLSYRKAFPGDRELFAYSRKTHIAQQDELIRFFNAIEIQGAVYIDIGCDDGEPLVALSGQFQRCISAGMTPASQAARQQNARINDLGNIAFLDQNGLLEAAASGADASAPEAGDVWIRLDCSEAPLDLDQYISLGLRMRASMLFAGVPQQRMQDLYGQYRMPGYAVHTIAAGGKLMYLFIAGHQVPKYTWFI